MKSTELTDDPGQHLVFVSHSGTDTWVARQIAREIAECGAVPFLDEAEIDVGADFEDDIHLPREGGRIGCATDTLGA